MRSLAVNELEHPRLCFDDLEEGPSLVPGSRDVPLDSRAVVVSGYVNSSEDEFIGGFLHGAEGTATVLKSQAELDRAQRFAKAAGARAFPTAVLLMLTEFLQRRTKLGVFLGQRSKPGDVANLVKLLSKSLNLKVCRF